MNRKQTILVFIAFFITLAVITIPLWINRVLPYLNPYLRAVIDTAEHWIDVLKKINLAAFEFSACYVFKSNSQKSYLRSWSYAAASRDADAKQYS